jgi:hypothetical protein
MLEYYEIKESELPGINDKKMLEIAKDLGEHFEMWRQARSVYDTQIVPECDKAFHCIRQPIHIPTLQTIDNGMLGDATLRVAVKGLRNEVLNQLFPPNEGWLEAASLEEDDSEDVLEKVKELQIRLHYEGQTKRAFTIGLDQLLVRGMTAIGVRWIRKRAVRRVSKNLITTLQESSEAIAQMDPTARPITKEEANKVRAWHEYYNGPMVFPIDIYRLYFDPTVELTQERDLPTCYITFKTLTELKYELDPDTRKPKYDQKALKDVTEYTYQEYYAENPQACESSKILGVDPTLETMDKFVPVYIFHRLEYVTEDGDVYIDKFFYVAKTKQDGGWRVIRVQDNPSEFGDKPYYISLFDEWLGASVGTGIVEKSLSDWKAKNLGQAVWQTGSILTILPPMWYFGEALKGKPKVGPMSMQEIINRPGVGPNWIGAYPVNPNGVQMQLVDQRYLGEKIIDQTGVTTAGVITNPTRELGDRKTATEIRQTASEGVTGQQVIVEKTAQELAQPVAQTVYNYSRSNYTQGTTFVARTPIGATKTVQLAAEEIDKERQIEIVGRRAVANKAHKMDQMMQAMEVLVSNNAAQLLGPGAILMVHDLLTQILSALGVPQKPEYQMSPQEIMAGNPQAQLQMLIQALQSPEGRQMAAEVLLNSLEGQQFIAQIVQAAQTAGHSKGAHEAQLMHAAKTANQAGGQPK